MSKELEFPTRIYVAKARKTEGVRHRHVRPCSYAKFVMTDQKSGRPMYAPDWSDVHDPLFMGELHGVNGESGQDVAG